MNRFDVPRSVGRVPQRSAQPSHGGVDAVLEVHVGVGRPESRSELFAIQHLARSLQQSFQEAEGLALQDNSDAALVKFSRPQVNPIGSERDNFRLLYRGHFGVLSSISAEISSRTLNGH